MRKAEAKHRRSSSLERLQRFLSWATERHPDFTPKKNHQEKWFSTYLGHQPPEIGRAARLVAEESIQMHGGIAMTWEYAVSHYAKRLIMLDAQLGDTDYHLSQVI